MFVKFNCLNKFFFKYIIWIKLRHLLSFCIVCQICANNVYKSFYEINFCSYVSRLILTHEFGFVAGHNYFIVAKNQSRELPVDPRAWTQW